MPRIHQILFALAATAATAAAQCTTDWQPGAALASTNRHVYEVARWDPDGPGPLPARLVAAWGDGTSGGVLAWDDLAAAWQPVGSAMDGPVLCVLGTANGDLFAGGAFVHAGGTAAAGIARWHGGAWHPLGSGVANASWPGSVATLEQLPDGSVFVGGTFSQAGPLATVCAARWHGAAWHAMHGGTNGLVASSCLLPNGDLVIAGSFTAAGATAASKVARWHGGAWHTIGAGVPWHCNDIERTADGLGLVAATAGGVYTWHGATWTALPTTTVYPKTVLPLPNGDVVTAGIGGGVQRFDGSVWHDLTFPDYGVTDDTFWTGEGDALFVGDYRTSTGGARPGVQVLRTSCAATVTSAGGCGAITVAADAPAWTGATFSTRVTGLPTSSLLLVVRGFSATNVPLPTILPQGTAGCTLRTSPDAVDLLLPTSGVARATLAIPADPALAGVTLHEQWLTLTFANGAIAGLDASNALTAVVGTF